MTKQAFWPETLLDWIFAAFLTTAVASAVAVTVVALSGSIVCK
jgi:hypothetical protein